MVLPPDIDIIGRLEALLGPFDALPGTLELP